MHFVSDTAPIISCLFRFEKSEGSDGSVVVFSGVQALTFQAPYRIRLEEVADPEIEQPHEALIRIRVSGLCGSDLHPYRGHETGCDKGTVMGHEFVGEVVAVGSAVRDFRPGRQVFSPFTTCCGSCPRCITGLTCRCAEGRLLGWRQDGVGLHGAQAQMIKIPLADSTLLEVPAGVSDEVALLLGDNLTTGYYGALRAGVKAGQSCVVVGCGTVGLMAVLCCGELGADPIYAVDLKESRRRRAAELGAVALSPEETDGLESLSVIEAVGNLQAMRTAYQLTAPGGALASVGVHTSAGFAFTPSELYDRNMTYRSGRCPARALAPDLIPLAQAQSRQLEALFTHRFSLSAGVQAYELFERGEDECQKVLLTT